MEKKRGLSLIESIVATAILAIILVSVYAIFQQGYSYMRKTRMSTTAYFLAQSKMEEFYNSSIVFSWPSGIHPDNSTPQTFGSPGSPYADYTWTATFSNYLGLPDLAEINVTVYWLGRSGQRSVSLVTLMGNG